MSGLIGVGLFCFVLGMWVGKKLGIYKFTYTADQPFGVEHNGHVYDVKERKL